MTYADYAGVEELGEFSPPTLDAYREMLLRKTKPQVEFIRKHVCPTSKVDGAKIRVSVIEVGCGNGRLLIGLDKAGLLSHGMGIDTSESRIKFASTWHRSLESTRLISWCVGDVLKMLNVPHADLSVCITGCFNYFNPKHEAHQLAEWMQQTGSMSLFELYKWRGCDYNKTTYFDADDPWFALNSQYRYDGFQQCTYHIKTFYKRDCTMDIRVEKVYTWTKIDFLKHLRLCGFRDIEWAVEDEDKLVVLAR